MVSSFGNSQCRGMLVIGKRPNDALCLIVRLRKANGQPITKEEI